MATQKKIETPLKGKSGTSPSPTQTKAKKTSTSTTPKLVPSYLKPTVSSSSHVDHQNPHPKRPLTSTYPSLNRRRSFEKLPSSSTIHKAPQNSLLAPSSENSSRHVDHQHPHPKKPLTSHTNPNLNRRRSLEKLPSSSTVHKSQHTSVLSASPALSRTQSSPKPLMKRLIPSSSAKVNTGMKKTMVSVSSTNEKEAEIEVDNGKKEDETNLVTNVKEEAVELIEINNDKLDEMEVPNAENPSVCEDVKASDSNNGKEPIADWGIEVVEEEKLVEHELVDNHVVKEDKNGINEQKLVEQEVIDNHVVKEDENAIKIEDKKEEKMEKEMNVNEKINVVNNEESIEMVSKEGEDGKEKDEKREEATIDVQNAKVETAKKEAQHVQYNDMIEETKTKLMEKRKNRVKALVGAFETVISLEEA